MKEAKEAIEFINSYKKEHLESESEIQKRLAETYLSSHQAKKEIPHIELKQRRLGIRKISLSTIISFLSITVAILLCYALLTHTLNINITVSKKGYLPYENLISTQRISLFGKSGFEEKYIMLSTSYKQSSAGVLIDLKNPVDLSKKQILISILSIKGSGKVKVILRDKNYRAYVSDILDINENKNGWQNFIISCDVPKESVDISNITHIRLVLEATKSKDRVSTFYIKNISLMNYKK